MDNDERAVNDFLAARELAERSRKMAEDTAAISSLTEEHAADAEYTLAVALIASGPRVVRGARYEHFRTAEGLDKVRVTPLTNDNNTWEGQ